MPIKGECEHGNLERSCVYCELDEAYDEIKTLEKKLEQQPFDVANKIRDEAKRITRIQHWPAIKAMLETVFSNLDISKNYRYWK